MTAFSTKKRINRIEMSFLRAFIPSMVPCICLPIKKYPHFQGNFSLTREEIGEKEEREIISYRYEARLFFPWLFDNADTIRDDICRDSLHIAGESRMICDIDEKSIAFSSWWERKDMCMSFSEKSRLMDILQIHIFMHIDFLIHGDDSLVGSIPKWEYIMKDLMSFDPEYLWNGECFFENLEHSRDASRGVRFDHVRERIVNSTFYIRFSDTIIGGRETRTHEHLTEMRIESRHVRDIFLIENEGNSMGFCHNFDGFLERAKKYSFSERAGGIDIPDLMESTKWTLWPSRIPSTLEQIENMTGFMVEDNISRFIFLFFDIVGFTEWEEGLVEWSFEHSYTIREYHWSSWFDLGRGYIGRWSLERPDHSCSVLWSHHPWESSHPVWIFRG